ncbi:MAG: hypothetical protein ACJAT2_001274 [Bacteriovoracaceae bacterium]|jgi:hypothetical protein
MDGLLAVERMVLESIAKGSTNELSIVKDTSLSKGFVSTLVENLIDYQLVELEKRKLILTKTTQNLIQFNKADNVKMELKDLFESMVDNHYAQSPLEEREQILKMQKIWLTDYEFKVMKSMMSNIENYIKSIRKDRLLHPEEEILSEQRVIFWGSDTYSNLIESTLAA